MPGRVLIIDDDRSMCEMLEADLRLRDFDCVWTTSPQTPCRCCTIQPFQVVLTDLQMPGMNGTELCERVAANRPDLPVVVMTAFGSLETAVAAMWRGAYDFVTKPIELDLLALTLQRAVRPSHAAGDGSRQLSQEVASLKRFDEILGTSPPMQELFDQLSRIADAEASVLITGESGTGKELVARAIHRQSRRKQQPFVPVNCAALPDALLESELFGHAKGAFTDARTARKGLILEADSGHAVSRRDRRFSTRHPGQTAAGPRGTEAPPGGWRPRSPLRRADSQCDESRPGNGGGRGAVPRGSVLPHQRDPGRCPSAAGPRRRHPAAGPALRELFAAPERKTSDRDLRCGRQRSSWGTAWPGNVRELRNVIERAVALTRYETLAVDDLPEKIRDYQNSRMVIGGNDPSELVPLEEVERRYILHVLNALGDNKTNAARVLGLDRKTLYRKLRQFDQARRQ